jgi:hypothetical protein
VFVLVLFSEAVDASIYKTPRSPRPPLARKQNDRRKQNNPETTPKQLEKEEKERGKRGDRQRGNTIRNPPDVSTSVIYLYPARTYGPPPVLRCFLLAAAHSMFHHLAA